MNRRTLLLLIPCVFTLHALEEAATIGRSLPGLRQRFSGPGVAVSVPLPAATPFRVGLILLAVAAFVIALAARADRPGSRPGYMLLALQATLLLNVGSHVLWAVVFDGYVPGLVTAVLVNLPFSFYVLSRAWREQWYSRRALAWLAPIALVLHGPVLMGIMATLGALGR
jgi:hypothetical protein